MKVVLSFLLGLVASSSAGSVRNVPPQVPSEITADSDFGRLLLSKARRVGGNNNYISYYDNGMYSGVYNGNKNYGGSSQSTEWQFYANYMLVGSSWLTGYSIKFQGCYDIMKWNEEAKDVEDVRLLSKQLVRFRLCPTEKCVPGYRDGCNSNYGDYLIDLDSYLNAYVQAKAAYEQWNDEVAQDKAWAQGNGMTYYGSDFDIRDYIQCRKSTIQLDNADNAGMYYQTVYGNYKSNAMYYYIGAYCGGQGGSILMGMFLDDACTIPADAKGGKLTYLAKTGYYLPFSDRSIIEYDCMSCQEPAGDDAHYNVQGDDASDEDLIQDFCEQTYLKSGKCETNLPKSFFNMYKVKNNNACNYIDGIKIIRQDGSIKTTNRLSPGHMNSKVVGSFLMVGLSSAFLGLAYYVYWLKSKFDRNVVAFE